MLKYFFLVLSCFAFFTGLVFAQTAPSNEEVLINMYGKYKKNGDEIWKEPLRYRASVKALESAINDVRNKDYTRAMYDIGYIIRTQQFDNSDTETLRLMVGNFPVSPTPSPTIPTVPSTHERRENVRVFQVPVLAIPLPPTPPPSTPPLYTPPVPVDKSDGNWLGIPYLNKGNWLELKHWFFGPSPEEKKRFYNDAKMDAIREMMRRRNR